MDNATLVKPDIEAGRRLLEGLDGECRCQWCAGDDPALRRYDRLGHFGHWLQWEQCERGLHSCNAHVPHVHL